MVVLPSPKAVRSNDEGLLDAGRGLVVTKCQLAIVRALADELERCVTRGGEAETIREQLVQELAKLGCHALEVAATIVDGDEEREPTSGIHLVASESFR